MGEIADDLAEGRTCSLCGMFFIDKDKSKEGEWHVYEHGYSVVCWECWDDLSKSERKHHQRAMAPLVN